MGMRSVESGKRGGRGVLVKRRLFCCAVELMAALRSVLCSHDARELERARGSGSTVATYADFRAEMQDARGDKTAGGVVVVGGAAGDM